MLQPKALIIGLAFSIRCQAGACRKRYRNRRPNIFAEYDHAASWQTRHAAIPIGGRCSRYNVDRSGYPSNHDHA
jgi:hypothetical protein